MRQNKKNKIGRFEQAQFIATSSKKPKLVKDKMLYSGK